MEATKTREEATETRNQGPRQLWQCLNAKVRGKVIQCAAGHVIDPQRNDGNANIERAVRGQPMCFAACQACQDYDEMGPPLEKEDRGWSAFVKKNT